MNRDHSKRTSLLIDKITNSIDHSRSGKSHATDVLPLSWEEVKRILKRKKYLGVAANLVAFACKLSFDLGFKGFVAFTAKTQLINHYTTMLGAECIKDERMMIASESAKKLVNSYYKSYFDEGQKQVP